MKVSWISRRSISIHFLFIVAFLSVTILSHFAPYPNYASPPLSNKTTHHKGYALEAKDSDSDIEKDHDFVKLHAVWAFLPISVVAWHSPTDPYYFIKSIEKNFLPPRSPPV